jgi:hypothetical protein
MAELTRSSKRLKHPGPYLAIVKNTIDTQFQGRLEVALIRGYVDNPDDIDGQLVKVRHVSPYAGSTNVMFNQDNAGFNSTQKSYGMWMVPPDPGSTVMVFFIEGYISQGYWFGCVTDRFANQMIPGIGSVELPSTALTQSDQQFYGSDPQSGTSSTYYLPVAEVNKARTGSLSNIPPIHPFAIQLASQGLLYDRVRGGTSSSARRESPSSVFGISTPGPFDVNSDNFLKRNDSYGGESLSTLPASRLGGNTFVMDDGDVNGDNELIRLRTRNGIQILLHNTQDLVYITNSQGTAWIEMTSNGKIDIFAQDSVSIHTEADFNLRADRNFNIEAGQDVNIKAFQNLNMDVSNSLSALVTNDALITSSSGGIYMKSKSSVNIATDAGFLVTGSGEIGLTGNLVNLTAPTANITGVINTPSVQVESNPPSASTAVTNAASAIPLNTVPYNNSGAGWSANSHYNAGTLLTTMLRVPVHEPWSQHENNDPVAYSSINTNNRPGAASVSTASSTVAQPLKVSLAKPIDGSWSPSSNSSNSISFTQGSGDQAHFLQATPGLQKAIQQAADTYQKATGKPLVLTSSFRSKQEQQNIYDRWKAAGGGPSNPTAGGITTPVNPAAGGTSAHMKGLGCDTPQAPELYALGILEPCGLAWPLGYKDKVHLILIGDPYPTE